MSASGPHTRFAPDRGLTGRMVTTMFLIGLLYVGFTGVLIVLLKGAWPLIVLLSGGLFIAQFWFSDKITERAMGARAGHPRAVPAVARHHRPPLRAGRHAQAPGRDRRHRHAQRVRHRPQPEQLRGLRDHRLMRRLEPRSSRACWPTSSRTSPTATSR